jgi:hypothetical protein
LPGRLGDALKTRYPLVECISNSTCSVISNDNMSIVIKETDIESNTRADQVVTMQLNHRPVSDIILIKTQYKISTKCPLVMHVCVTLEPLVKSFHYICMPSQFSSSLNKCFEKLFTTSNRQYRDKIHFLPGLVDDTFAVYWFSAASK